MTRITRSTRSAKITTIITGSIVFAFLSTLWVFHIFLGGPGQAAFSTQATFAYLFIYMIFSLISYKTYLYEGMSSYEESFIFFNIIPMLLLGLLWLLIFKSGMLYNVQ